MLAPSRRHVLHMFAGGAAFALGIRPGAAGEARIDRLIDEAAAWPTIAQRIDYISHALVGTPYLADGLIGGPKEPERFVARDDGFDCVTFCETVLAAARVFRPGDYAAALRKIRYREGAVEWRERNHYFSDWYEFNIANGVCRAVPMPGGVAVVKTLSWMRELGPRPMSLMAVPRASLLAHKERLATGDIIGFLSQRARLDFFHTGFIVVREEVPWLRHAAKSRGRVVDQPLRRFLDANGVRAVTLLRPQEPWVENRIV